MQVNTEPIPLAIGILVFGTLVWLIRVRLTEISDNFYGRERSDEARRRYARSAIVGVIFSIAVAAFLLLSPTFRD
jgi:hypothetical protein